MMAEPTTAYCAECKAIREMIDIEPVKMPQGGKELPALKGVCPVCGADLFRLQSAEPNVSV